MLNGGMGFDFKALKAKALSAGTDLAKKEALKEAQKQLDKYAGKKPAPAAAAPAAGGGAVAAISNMSNKTKYMIAGGAALLALIVYLNYFAKSKPKKELSIEKDALAYDNAQFLPQHEGAK